MVWFQRSALGCQGNKTIINSTALQCTGDLSVQHDNDEMISSLMSASSSLGLGVINRQSHGGYTPLHVAAINKSQRAFSTLMMDFKADRLNWNKLTTTSNNWILSWQEDPGLQREDCNILPEKCYQLGSGTEEKSFELQMNLSFYYTS